MSNGIQLWTRNTQNIISLMFGLGSNQGSKLTNKSLVYRLELWSIIILHWNVNNGHRLRRKPQEENLRRFWNQMGFPLKFTPLPVHWYHTALQVIFLAGNGKNRESPFKSRGVYGGSSLSELLSCIKVISITCHWRMFPISSVQVIPNILPCKTMLRLGDILFWLVNYYLQRCKIMQRGG